MNNKMRLHYGWILFTLFLSNISLAQSFSGGKTEQQLEQEAFTFFDSEEYQKALPLYRELINVYPQDPEYNYYLGVCQVELNENIKEAIQHLKIASTKNVNASVPYYLGRAFHMTYQFNSAIRYYRTFSEYYKKKSIGIDRLIEMCQNGLPLVNSYFVVDLKKKKVVDKDDFFRFYDLEGFDDRLSQKAASLKSRYDGAGDKDVACLANKGQYIYFSSFGKNKKTGRDLFRAKRLKNGGWGEWEALTPLNTDFDEIYPFMSGDERTLYFCSQGHSSMGGFDIFQSVYNEITDTWSEPQNLGFPINSTSNDLFYAVDVNGEFACFASSRENGKNELTIYKIKIPTYSEQKVVLDPNLLPEIAVLKSGKESNSDFSNQADEVELPMYVNKYGENNFPYFNFPVSSELIYHYLTEFKSSDAKKLFVGAKNDEFNTDSLNRVTEGLRKELNGLQGNPKSILSKKISVFEQKVFELGQNSEKKLAKALNLESDYLKQNVVGTVEANTIAPKKQEQLIMTSENLSASSNQSLSTGYVYHIQIGVFSIRQKSDFFSGLGPVIEEVVGDGKLYKYLVGNHSSFTSAKRAVPEVKQKFPNAFVVAYKDGVKADLSEAIKATDQNYKPQKMESPIVENVKPAVLESRTNDVLFKVQVGAYSGDVPEDVKVKLEKFSKYIIDYSKDYRGYTICTVGSFDSYSKVSKLKMELREAGLVDAFTVAFSGNDKITIQQALEILRQ